MLFCNNKLLLIMILFVINPLDGNSQEIKIGASCPDVILKNVLNFETDEIRIKDLRGKFIIIDFWGTHCGACISSFPKLDSLQKKYAGLLQIIAVNKEDRDYTTQFFTRMKHIKKPSIPFVTGDTLLSKLFPHVYIPHHVWIDSTGIVRYITDGYNATEDHIDIFLKNDSNLLLAEKKYEKTYFYENPMAALINKKGIDQLESYSLLMHCMSGITFPNAATSTTKNERANRITQTCSSIAQLYETAFNQDGKHDFSAENTIIYNVTDKSRFVIPKNNNLMDEWMKNFSFNYELMVPPSDGNILYEKMQQDLSRYFNAKGVIEKRLVKCLLLVQTGNAQVLRTKGGQPSTNFWIMNADSVRFMINQPFATLVTSLSLSYKAKKNDIPFIDVTHYKGNIDIQLSSEAITTFNLKSLRSQLKKYGLDLKIAKIQREVLVLNELR